MPPSTQKHIYAYLRIKEKQSPKYLGDAATTLREFDGGPASVASTILSKRDTPKRSGHHSRALLEATESPNSQKPSLCNVDIRGCNSSEQSQIAADVDTDQSINFSGLLRKKTNTASIVGEQ